MAQETIKVLIIDDDTRLRNLLERYLTEQNFQVKTASDSEQMDKHLERENFHLIILDLMLPKEDGLSICKRLRHNNFETPIVMLTAKGDEVDRIIGLELGADDYIHKPFNPRELLARINAILRRGNSFYYINTQEKSKNKIQFGHFQLDLAAREMRKNNETIPLTSAEFAVLKALITHPHEPMSRDKLMNQARGRDYSALERSIDVQISRLRKLIEEDPTKPKFIQTVWGLGYVFIPDEISQ